MSDPRTRDLDQALLRLTDAVENAAVELEKLRTLREHEMNVRVVTHADGSDPVAVDASPRNLGPDEGEVAPPGVKFGEELRRQSADAEREQLEREISGNVSPADEMIKLREEWLRLAAEREVKQED